MEYEWNIMGAVYVRDRLLDVGIYVEYMWYIMTNEEVNQQIW